MEEKQDKQKKQSFWSIVPGILTGCAAIIGAIGSLGVLITALVTLGFIEPPFAKSTPLPPSTVTEAVTLPSPTDAPPPPPSPTNTPVPLATATATLVSVQIIPTESPTEQPIAQIYSRSCQGILDNGQGRGDDYYTIDVDGSSGQLEPFEVYCDMTREGGGWTLFAYHTDGIKVLEVDKVMKSETGVMQSERWRTVRDNMTTGMMFVDEDERVSRISATKLNGGSCKDMQDAESLIPLGSDTGIWHDERDGCNKKNQDYSLINLTDSSSGAALYQQSGIKFDIWPRTYPAAYSYKEQNELFYFIK